MPVRLLPQFTLSGRNHRKCSICNLPPGEDKRAVDLGTFIDMEGEYEICTRCAGHIAKAIGWVSPAEAAVLDQLVKDAVLRAESAEAEMETASQLFEDQAATIRVLSAQLGLSAHQISLIADALPAPEVQHAG